MAGSIGLKLLSIWNRKKLVFPILIAICLVAWASQYIIGPSLLLLGLALIPIVLTLIFALIGLIVLADIERTGDLEELPRLTTQTLVGVALVLAVLIYLGGMLFGVFPPPPLPFLLATLTAIQVAPIAILVVLIPPLVGFIPRLRPKWVALRRRYPFWAIYLGTVAGLLTVVIPFMYPELLVIGGAGIRALAMGSALVICSGLLAMAPAKLSAKTADFVTSVLGFIMVFLGVILWLGPLGGLFFGSIFAVLGGAHAHSWKMEETE